MNHAIPNFKVIYENGKPFYYDKVEPEPHRYEDSWSFGWASFFDDGGVHTWDEDGVGGQNWQHDPTSGEDKYSEALKRTPHKNPSKLKIDDQIYLGEEWYKKTSKTQCWRKNYKEIIAFPMPLGADPVPTLKQPPKTMPISLATKIFTIKGVSVELRETCETTM